MDVFCLHFLLHHFYAFGNSIELCMHSNAFAALSKVGTFRGTGAKIVFCVFHIIFPLFQFYGILQNDLHQPKLQPAKVVYYKGRTH